MTLLILAILIYLIFWHTDKVIVALFWLGAGMVGLLAFGELILVVIIILAALALR